MKGKKRTERSKLNEEGLKQIFQQIPRIVGSAPKYFLQWRQISELSGDIFSRGIKKFHASVSTVLQFEVQLFFIKYIYIYLN